MPTGKMSEFEKSFVNSDRHSRTVSLYTERLLALAHPRPGQRYLDVGCGNGAAPVYVARNFQLNVSGVDVDPEQIALAQATSKGMKNIRFLAIDSRSLPFHDGEFDIVFTNKVTHHIRDWEQAVMEMVRVLKPGGYLIYADFILPSLAASLGRAIVANRRDFPTRRVLDDLFTKSGLQSVHRKIQPMHFEGVFLKARA